MRTKHNLFGLTLLLFFSCQLTLANELPEQLKFSHLSTKHGLAQNSVRALVQDRNGFVWIATQAGLHRYDGYKFLTFRHNPTNKNSISSNLVVALETDEDGMLWIGTIPGTLNKLNPVTGNFTIVQFPKLSGEGFIRQLLSSNDNLWIAIDDKFFILNKNTLILKEINLQQKNTNKAIAIIKKNQHQYWLIKDSGIILFDENDSAIISSQKFTLNTGEKISNAIRHDKHIYLSTTQGNLYTYSPEQPHLELKWSSQEALSIQRPINLWTMAVKDNVFWMATEKNGLIKYQINSDITSHFINDPRKPSSIADNNLRSLMIDNSGLIWLGTSSSGVERTTGATGPFKLYQDYSKSQTHSNDIRASLVTSDKKYWLAIHDGTLKQFFPLTNEYHHYPLPETKLSSKTNVGPSALIETSNGDILYGSKFGLWKFEPEEKQFSQLSEMDKSGNSGEAILAFHKDQNNRIWVGSSNSGIGLFNEQTENIDWFPAIKENLSNMSNFILHITSAGKNLLWVGTSKGLAQFDTIKRQYIIPEFSNQLLDGSVIRTLYKDINNILWVGTLSGVFSLQFQENKWRLSYPMEHIPSLQGNIYAFLSEANGVLWISSNSGITRVVPETGEFQTYNSQHGLQGEEFNGNIAFKTGGNLFWFGGLNGLNSFNPETIERNEFESPVWITSYQINDKYYPVNDSAFFTELILPNQTQYLKLEFASLDYYQTNKNLYKIKYQSSSQEWIELNNQNEISFTQLESGTFKLCIMGSNHDGIWNPNCRALVITLEPKFWETNIAYAFYFLTILLLSLSFYYYLQKRNLVKKKILTKLRESQEQLSWSLQGSGDALWIWDVKTGKAKRTGINRLLGYKPGEIDEANSNLDSLIHPDDLEATQRTISKHLKTLKIEQFEHEYRMKNANGNWCWILDRGQIVSLDAQGKPNKIAGTFRDITHIKKSFEEQKLSALIIRNMAEMVMVTDKNLRILSANPSWCHKMGYQIHEILGKDPSLFNSVNKDPDFYKSVREHLFKFGNWQGEMLHSKRNSQDILTYMELTLVKGSDQNTRHIVSVSTDITEKKRAEEELRYLANYDMLTSLPNRTLFLDRLEHAILQAQRNNNSIALLFIDLDNFKNINDTLGHNYGDLLLKEAARIISHCVRKDDTVSRIGGDEFTVILENISDAVSVFHIAEKIIEAFKQTIQISERLITSSPSIGISLYPEDASNSSSLVKFADTAMYFAKSQGKNNFQFYSDDMNQNALRRLDLESHLRTALDNNEFHLAYQPKIDTHTGRITGMEALLRWNNPVLGNITPDEFIPLAEDTGLIVPIGEWVIFEACSQAKKWFDSGFTTLEISVNLSFRQFKNSDLSNLVKSILKKTQLPGQNLTLEITESLLMDSVAKATEQLQRLKQLGLKIAIDDFGTGYSSLNYLKQFPLDYLKIDRTFIKDILSNQNDASLTSAIISLSHNLDLAVIAEGVEMIEQVAFLKKSGCEEIQGFLVSPPITDDDFGQLLITMKDKNIFSLLAEEQQ